MQWICDRTLDWFVVLREWSISKSCQRTKYATDALRVHDEGPHVVFRIGIHLEIGYIVSNPSLLRLIPPDLPAARIPGLAFHVAGRGVVKHAAVGRPRPGPVWINSQPRRIFRSASCELWSGFSPASGIDPVAARSRAIVLQPTKPGYLLTRLDRLLCQRVSDIGECFAVDLFRDLRQRRILRRRVRPGQIQNRIGKPAALLPVKLAQLEKDPRHHFLVKFAFAGWWQRRILPLQPARGVCK